MKLELYIELLRKWNKIHSLSGAKDTEDIRANLELSLYPLEISSLDLSKKKLMLDIGSGNGFPAVPLGIKLGVTTILCEPNVKKSAFLHNLKSELSLDSFNILRKKIEDVSIDEFEIKFNSKPDLITSRATFEIGELLDKCRHMIDRCTTILLFKGTNVDYELSKLSIKYEVYRHGLVNYIVIKGENLCNG